MRKRRSRRAWLVLGVVLVGLIILLLLFAPQYAGLIEVVRSVVFPAADLDRELSWKDEPDFVYDCPPDEFAHDLARHGFTRNPAAYLVTVDGDDGESWAYRPYPTAAYQTHASIFEKDGDTHVYVHREWNAHRHPLRHANNPGGPSLTPDGAAVFEAVMATTPTDRDDHQFARVTTAIRDIAAIQTTCSQKPV